MNQIWREQPERSSVPSDFYVIGNAYPYLDTGYLVVEEGDIDALSWQLVVHQYRVLDKYGALVRDGFSTRDEAGRFIEEVLLPNLKGKC